MRGIDTNVLVRYLTNDDAKQAELVQRLFEDCRQGREHLFVPAVVLCELVWVLDRVYEQSKSQISIVLDRLLNTDIFRFEHEPLVRASLAHFKTGSATFPDSVIGEIGRKAGCRDTVTFDHGLRKAAGFTILG